jgi:nucleotide-binding universal stress UspA family protein
MTYRTILVYADAAPQATARLQTAASIAARTGATLDGVFITPPFVPPVGGIDGAGFVPPDTLQLMLDGHLEYVRQAAQTARTKFETAAGEVGARGEWTMLGDETALGFVAMARASDLVVFPSSGTSYPLLPPTEFAREASTPIVLVPATPRSHEPCRTVLVAWNGSREAASALRGAWPILEAAERVEVLMVDPLPEAEAFLRKRLERRSIQARIVIDRSSDAKAGELIRSHAEDLAADLVVMGLYGHARLREMILGGASKTMLDQEIFPLLVAR